MKVLFVRVVSTTLATLTLCAAFSVPANAAGNGTPLAIAQAAYKAARASHGAMSTSEELDQAALNANYKVELFPNGYETEFDRTLPGDHGNALLANLAHGGFGCVHISSSIAIAPTSVLCPARYLFVLYPDPKASSKKFVVATEAAGAIGLVASYMANTKSGSAISSEVPKILKLVSGLTAKHNASGWNVTVRGVSVCLSFTSKGAFSVRNGACA